MKAKVVIVCVCCALLVTSAFSQMRTGENVVIEDAVNDDLYVGGGKITINAPIRGDLIVTGGTILINDSFLSSLP